MASFGYRSNPLYAIKECSSCGTLYTRDCGCSKGNVEGKILVPKPPKNYARCTRCGYLVDGPNCQGCALLCQELEETLVTHSPDFQNTSELSNASTNVVNPPREPYVVKQDHGKLPVCYDDDDYEERSDSLDDNIIFGLPPFSAIKPNELVLSTEEPDNSLSMRDEHLDTILATKSDEFIKSGVETLIPIPKVMEIVIPETKSSSTFLNSLLEETNNFDNYLPEFTTFSNVPCDAEYESDSSNDQSCFDEDVLEKIVLKPLFEEEIIPMKIDQHPDNAESDLMESLRTHDSSLLISCKIDSLLVEFSDELTLLKSILSRINETDCDFEEDIRLIEKLLYDNSSPCLPEEFVSVNSDAKIKSFSPSPILVKDSDSLMEEIDLFCTPNYPMPLGIEDEDYDFEMDILIPKDLPSNNSLSFA
nr:hypothetical protein [Tanacetum cinerariifolium]